jgi:anti-sigma regulatory factor (Ser/Thr protein kinase)
MSSRVDVVHGSLPARDLEPGSDVGPALDLGDPVPDEPVPYPWPSHDCLQFGALPTAVACARLHARNLLWEWGVDWFASDAELLVSELVTNAVKVTAARDEAAISLRLSSDGTRVLIEVWDADPWPPVAAARGQDGRPDPAERGLILVAALSARWDWYLTKDPAGKVVWCEIEALRSGQLRVGQLNQLQGLLAEPVSGRRVVGPPERVEQGLGRRRGGPSGLAVVGVVPRPDAAGRVALAV